jgi:DNA-binding transcriptional regulator YiaG
MKDITITTEQWSLLLKNWRSAGHLTQPQAAALIGISCKTFEKWEQKRMRPVGKNLRKLREMFSLEEEA